MNEGELLGISSYPQLLGVMRELRGQLERDLEVTGNKIPVLKASLSPNELHYIWSGRWRF